MFHVYIANSLHVQYQCVIYRRMFITDYRRHKACNLFLKLVNNNTNTTVAATEGCGLSLALNMAAMYR
jgi:hypothetical protein